MISSSDDGFTINNLQGEINCFFAIVKDFHNRILTLKENILTLLLKKKHYFSSKLLRQLFPLKLAKNFWRLQFKDLLGANTKNLTSKLHFICFIAKL